MKAGSIIPRGDILKSNNNWTPNWTPNLHIEFFPAEGIASAFDYYTGSAVVPITASLANNTVNLQFGDPGTPGKVEVYNVDRFSTVVRNGQPLTNGTDFAYDAAAQRLVIPFAGSTNASVSLAPSVNAGPDATIFKGATFMSAGSFFEVGGVSWTGTVDYGDGSGEQPLALNGMSFVLNHVYTDVGHFNLVVKVTDDVGRVGTDTALVNVIYAFNGFFAPTGNPPEVNSARAGSTVPVKFSLSGYQGPSPFSVGSEQYDCATGDPLGAIEPTSSPGASAVQYDPRLDQYQYLAHEVNEVSSWRFHDGAQTSAFVAHAYRHPCAR